MTTNRARHAALCCVIFSILGFRIVDRLADPQFWAEDGVIFFQQALERGALAAIFVPYAGYLHVLPRLIAAVGTLFPVLWVPALYTVVALAIEAWCCSFFALPRFRAVVRSDALRYACCIVLAAVPVGYDLTGNLANLQWYIGIVVALQLLVPGDYDHSRFFGLQLVGAYVLVLTASEAIVFAPLTFYRLLISRGRRNTYYAAMFVATLVQIGVYLANRTASDAVDRPRVILGTVAKLLVFKVELSDVFGVATVRALPVSYKLAEFAGALVLVALFVLAARRLPLLGSLAALYLFVVPPILFIYARGLGAILDNPSTDVFWGSPRYTVLSVFILIVAVAILCEWLLERRPAFAIAPFALIFSMGIVFNFSHGRWLNMDWPAEAAAIENWEGAGPRPAVDARINPDWHVLLPAKSATPRS